VTPIDISIIVPALNEADNLVLLAPRVHSAMAGRPYELLIVDDNSRDRTPDVCAELSKTYPLRLIVRTQPRNGLSGAVLHGMAEAKGEYLVVMDADLQHPPERLPDLVKPVETGEAEFVIGSRYVAGGTTGEKWTLFRKLNSHVATILARPFSGNVLDPMSGFFALRRSTYERAQRLTPLGYKIGLELMCKCRVQKTKEIPIHFSTREHGESKLSLKQQFKYLEHLSRLYDFCYPRLSPIIKFGIVTLCAWLVGFGIFVAMLATGMHTSLAVSIAYATSVGVTAVFHARYVRTQHEFLVRHRPWRDFLLSSIAEVAACFLVSFYLVYRTHDLTGQEVFLLSFGIAMFVRYILRKELLLDVRGLRHEIRKDELA
jgi:dolichol-phosphate mannosyltransferase